MNDWSLGLFTQLAFKVNFWEEWKKIQNFLYFFFYRSQRSWGKVIFSKACVKDSVHRGGPGRHPQEQTPPWEQTYPGEQTYPQGADTPPPGAVYAGRYGQQAGGTHPTGMHTCFYTSIIRTGQWAPWIVKGLLRKSQQSLKQECLFVHCEDAITVCDFCWELIPDIRSGYWQNLPDRIESYRTE